MSTQQKVQSKTATFVKAAVGFAGEASLYKMEPPLDGLEYVVVSSITEDSFERSLGSLVGNVPSSETALVPATADGSPDLEALFSAAGAVDVPAWLSARVSPVAPDADFLRTTVGYEVQA